MILCALFTAVGIVLNAKGYDLISFGFALGAVIALKNKI